MNAPRKDTGKRLEEFSAIWLKNLQGFKPAGTVRTALEQGAALLMVKQITDHGSWRNKVNQLGLEASSAARLMACARRFNAAKPAFLDAVGSFSKLHELLPLDGDMCEDLMVGKPVHGLTLEAISAMTTKELRDAVRALRAAENESCSALTPRQQARIDGLITPVEKLPWPGQLTVDEERMLRLFRQCNAKAQEALFTVAEALALR